jgi:hypothetical protein
MEVLKTPSPGGAPMLSPAELYPSVLAWLQALGLAPHRAALGGLAHLVTALLLAQSLRPSALMRALSSPQPVPARQRYKRVRRALGRAWLAPARLTPPLVRAALALAPPDERGLTHLALDSVRCGRWEVFTLGVAWHGRALVVGWAVLPYPWPKGRFTPAVCALVRQVAASWPPDRPAHLVADRAFPSHALLEELARARWGWTLRLSARHHVTVGGRCQQVRAHLAAADRDAWAATAAAYGGPASPRRGTLVLGRGLAVLPAWRANAGSLRAEAARGARRARHLASKHRGRAATPQTDAWVALFSSHAEPLAAVRSYGRRWGIEGAYRDAQGGWDGKHGWDLEPTLARLAAAADVAAVVGLWALGSLIQSHLGDQAGRRDAPPAVRAIRREWTTTGRLSVWARGRFALTDPSGRLRAWALAALTAGAARLARPAPGQAPPAALREAA